MRAFIVAFVAQCGAVEGRPAGEVWGPGIPPEASTGDSTGDRPRLDLGVDPPLPDLPHMSDETGSTGGQDSTGEGTSTGGTTGAPASTEGSTTGDSTSTGPGGFTSTGLESTSTGDPPPPPPACGDAVCDPSERVTCYVVGPGWCKLDCYKDPACLTDCPCDGIVDGLCDLSPGTCDAVKPGGLCDPNGDGSFMDGNFTAAWLAWQAKCK